MVVVGGFRFCGPKRHWQEDSQIDNYINVSKISYRSGAMHALLKMALQPMRSHNVF